MRPEPGIAFWDAIKLVKFPNFFPAERISLQNMMPVVSKVSSLEISPILVAHGRKFWFDLFGLRATRTWDRILRCDKIGQISKCLLWRENFATEHDASGPESIPPGNFTHFCRPTVKKYESVFLTIVRVNGGFDHPATKIHVQLFWPSCDYYPISVLLANCATNGELMKHEIPIKYEKCIESVLYFVVFHENTHKIGKTKSV